MQNMNYPKSSMPYSQNLINQMVDDNEAITACREPSGLIAVPVVHEKYEINSMSMARENRQDLKTTELLRNQEMKQDCLNFNAGFFGGSSLKSHQKVELKDEFGTVLQEQHRWQNTNKIGTVAGG